MGSTPSFRSGPVWVRPPATSANLGPGFDALGLALDWHDEVEMEVTSTGLVVEITGEGADDLPRDERHLLVRAARATFVALGGQPPGLRLVCRNRIPQARGLGSSSAAVVGGIVAARSLVEEGESRLDDAAALALANAIEGHPDNVAACLFGGVTIAWTDSLADTAPGAGGGRPDGAGIDPASDSGAIGIGAAGIDAEAGIGAVGIDPGAGIGAAGIGAGGIGAAGIGAGIDIDATGRVARAVRLEPAAALRTVVCVPALRGYTATSRGLLPERVPHADAAANAGRAALLTHALTAAPELLLPATRDWLHQRYRAASMPRSGALVEALRAEGIAAVISGAGPTVLALGTAPELGAAVAEIADRTAGPGVFATTPVAPRGAGAAAGVEFAGARR